MIVWHSISLPNRADSKAFKNKTLDFPWTNNLLGSKPQLFSIMAILCRPTGNFFSSFEKFGIPNFQVSCVCEGSSRKFSSTTKMSIFGKSCGLHTESQLVCLLCAVLCCFCAALCCCLLFPSHHSCRICAGLHPFHSTNRHHQ